METPVPASVPPHPVEHPERSGVGRQHDSGVPRADRANTYRRHEGNLGDPHRSIAQVFGPWTHGNGRTVAGGRQQATTAIGRDGGHAAIRSRLRLAHRLAAACRSGDWLGDAGRLGPAAPMEPPGNGRGSVDGGDARSLGDDDARSSVFTTPGAGTAGTRGQENADGQRPGEQAPGATTTGMTAPNSPRAAVQTHAHPGGKRCARVGSSPDHRNPSSGDPSHAWETRGGQPIFPVPSGRRPRLAAPRRPQDHTLVRAAGQHSGKSPQIRAGSGCGRRSATPFAPPDRRPHRCGNRPRHGRGRIMPGDHLPWTTSLTVGTLPSGRPHAMRNRGLSRCQRQRFHCGRGGGGAPGA